MILGNNRDGWRSAPISGTMKKIELTKKRGGILFVISAPSGGGKTTISREVLKSLPDLQHSLSATTRSPRSGEIDGEDYFFISEDEFRQKIKKNKFLEWAKVHGNYYGTLQENLRLAQREKKDLILTIDVQGAVAIRKKRKKNVSIFLFPPSLKILAERLKKRGFDSPEEIEKRLEIAKKELLQARKYEYLIINQDFSQAVLELKSIIIAERCKQRK